MAWRSGSSYRAASRSRAMAASGVDDSPTANRGCRPRSRSATERPAARSARARIVPAKPEPTTATSTRSVIGSRSRRPAPPAHPTGSIRSSRSRRAGRQAAQREKASRSQVSAVTTAPRRPAPGPRVERRLQVRQRRRAPDPAPGQLFHGAAAPPGRDHRHPLRPGLDRVRHRAHRPLHLLRRRHAGQPDLDEGAHADAPRPQEPGRRREVLQLHPLVETWERLRVDGLQADGDLQRAVQPLGEGRPARPRAGAPAGGGTRPPPGSAPASRSARPSPVRRRHRAGLEEVAGVVELDDVRGEVERRPPPAPPHLGEQRPGGRRAVQGVAPEVAEDAGEGALGPDQEEGEGRRCAPSRLTRQPLGLHQDRRRRPGVARVPRRRVTKPPNPLGPEASGSLHQDRVTGRGIRKWLR